MNEFVSLTRRNLIISASAFAGGLAIGVSPARAAFSDSNPWAGADEPLEFTSWLAIQPDGEVIVRVTMPDIGNGVMTQIPMTINEELRADWSKIRAEYADTNRDFRENRVYSKVEGRTGYFSGRSTATERTQTALQVGASARERLKAAAAEVWGVSAKDVEAENSILTHKPTGRTLTYGDVAEAASRVQLASEPAPKPRSEWDTLTKVSRSKLQDPMLVNGSATYGIDVNVPDKVYAALKQVPVHGGRLKGFNKAAIMDMLGVLDVVVVDPDEPRKEMSVEAPYPLFFSTAQAAVAVIAEHYWQAKTALDALPVEWDLGAGTQWTSNEKVKSTALGVIQTEGKVSLAEGDAPKAIAEAQKVFEQDYYSGYADQAALEPLNGTALVAKDRVDVWMPTQHTELAHIVAAQEADVELTDVYMHQTFIGGAFGRRYFSDDTRMVVAVAKKFPGRPVHTIWSREETMSQGRYRPMSAVKIKAGVSDDGYPTSFLVRLASNGQQDQYLKDSPYTGGGAIPSIQVEQHFLPLNFLVGAYRGPFYNTNAFVMESFVDELAHESGIDPLDYRLKLLEPWADPGWANLLQKLAQRAGWGESLPAGQGMGIAIGNFGYNGEPQKGTTAAAVARVEVSKSGELKVLQLDVGADPGTILNPDAFETQLYGATLFGLNMALLEEMDIENGVVVSDNFDTYPMLRLRDIPENIRTHLDVTSGHERMGEAGEPPVGPVAPALANAIFQATGKRIRSLPFRKVDLSWG